MSAGNSRSDMSGPGKCRELRGCMSLDCSFQVVVVVCAQEGDGLTERPRLGTADEDSVQDGKNSAWPGSRLGRGRTPNSPMEVPASGA
jgi:hypothetical protein